jgi:putative addiction module killer protein
VVDELIEIRVYRGRRSQSPFFKWLVSQKDQRAVAIIQARLNRIRLGNFGDSKLVGGGVEELRVDFGPGYRIYFGRDGKTVVVLLCAGSKQTQSKDIETARAFWRDYLDDKD